MYLNINAVVYNNFTCWGEVLFFSLDPAIGCSARDGDGDLSKVSSLGKSYMRETRSNPNCSPRPTTLLICEAVEGEGSRDARYLRKRKTHAKLAHLKSFASFPRAFGFCDFCAISQRRVCAVIPLVHIILPAGSLSLSLSHT